MRGVRLAIFGLLAILHSSFSPRQCAAQGVISTVAGGSSFFQGDPRPAVQAPLGRINAVAMEQTADPGGASVVT